MQTDSDSEDSDLDDFVELSGSDIFDDLDDSDSDTDTPKKKKLKSPKKGEIIIIESSDSESSATDINQDFLKTKSNGLSAECETSSDTTDNIKDPKHVRFKSGTEQSQKVKSERPKAKTKQRRRKSDIRSYFTPVKAKKSRQSSGRLRSTTVQNSARKIPCRRNVRGETPMHGACIRGDLDRVKLLVKNDHDVNAKDNLSWTPLHEAANHNHVEIVGYLLDNGADVDPQGGDDLETPLIDAASNGHIATMKLLIEKGANCKLRDKKDQTALDVLLKWNKNENSSDVQFLRDYTELLTMLKTNLGHKEPSTSKSKTKKKLSADKQSYSHVVNHTEQVTAKSKIKKVSSAEQPSSSHDIDGTEIQADTDDTEEWGGEDIEQSSENHTRKTVHYSEPHLDNKEVVLLIPSKLQVQYEEYVGVQAELGVREDQCIVWPSIHLRDSITEEHIPHIMLDVVECVRNGELSKLSALLTSFNVEKYDALVQHNKDGLEKNILYFEMVADLAEINRDSKRKVGRVLDTGFLKVLVIHLYSDIPTHRHLISSSLELLYSWNTAAAIRKMSDHPKRKEEYAKLLKWLRSRLVCCYHTDIYPSRQSLFPMEKILYSEQFSNSVTTDLNSELTNSRRRSSIDSDSEILVLCIDGANREIMKYKAFVKQAILTFSNDSMCKEIYFIVSVEKSDQIDSLFDLVPKHLVGNSKVFTAFNPEKVQPSCILIHIKLDDKQFELFRVRRRKMHERSLSPMNVEETEQRLSPLKCTYPPDLLCREPDYKIKCQFLSQMCRLEPVPATTRLLNEIIYKAVEEDRRRRLKRRRLQQESSDNDGTNSDQSGDSGEDRKANISQSNSSSLIISPSQKNYVTSQSDINRLYSVTNNSADSLSQLSDLTTSVMRRTSDVKTEPGVISSSREKLSKSFAEEFHRSVLQTTRQKEISQKSGEVSIQGHSSRHEGHSSRSFQGHQYGIDQWPGIETVMETYQRHNTDGNQERQLLVNRTKSLKLENKELSKSAEILSKRMEDLLKNKRQLEEERQYRQTRIDGLKSAIKRLKN